ncbi:MAG: glycosyl hydrolase family 17 protein [Methylococcaceae bacterium]
MKISRLLLFMLMVIAVNGLFSWLSNLPQDAGPDVPDGKISSVSFAPFREGESPLTEVFPTAEEIDEDLRLLSTETHTIRTYASTRGLTDVAAMAQKYGLNVIQGAWIGGMTMAEENQAEIDQLIKVANQYPDVIKRVIVGNEVLLRGELKPEQLLQYIRQVKKAVKQPVSYADVWSFYIRYPEIAKEVDFFTVHILPYWEDEPLKIEDTAAHIEKNYRKIREAYPDKPILIGESGWPSAGRQRGWAVPSVVNEAKFIRSLVQLANKNGFDYNIVEAFNQPWKSQLEGVVGANWGLYSADRKLVFPLTCNVTENPLWLEQLLYAGLITLLVVGWQAKALVELGSLRLLGFIGFTQLLSVLLVNQVAGNWYTSYSLIERLHALCIAGLSVLLGALILLRTLDRLSDKISEKSGVWIRYLMLAFIAIALYKSQALALNGRYLSFPSPQTIIPVVGTVGFMLMSYLVNRKHFTFARAINDLLGTQTLSVQRAKIIGWVLAVTGLSLIIFETAFVMQNSNYEQAYPIVYERIYAALMVTINYSQLFGWPLLITAALLKIPLRAGAYALAFMVLAIITGETCTFIMGHDFIESYPNVGERIWISFVYTITNPQLLLWLASLLILALPLWKYQEKKALGA